MAPKGPDQPEYITIPEASRRLGIGLRSLRRRAREECFAVYSADSAWPRVKLSEVEGWLRSTRVRVSNHVRARTDEILEREQRTDGARRNTDAQICHEKSLDALAPAKNTMARQTGKSRRAHGMENEDEEREPQIRL